MSTFIKGDSVANATRYALYEKKYNIHDPNNLIYNINEPTGFDPSDRPVVNGITFAIDADGSVTAKGTATKDTTFTIYETEAFELTQGTYYLSGCPRGGSTDTFCLKLEYVAGGGKILTDTGSGTSVQVSNSYSNVPLTMYIQIAKGDTVNYIWFKPLFTKVPNATFINAALPDYYLKINEKSTIDFEVSAMGLEAGTHTLAVKAMADGYDDSDYSNEVTYTQT